MVVENTEFDKFIAFTSSTIKQCMAKIDANQKGVLIIVDDNNKLLGTLSDGDIRRAILRGKSIDDVIVGSYFTNPAYIAPSQVVNLSVEYFLEKHVTLLPVVNTDHIVTKVYTIETGIHFPPIENPVVMMVGGEGLRLAPLTNDTPKTLLKVGDKPILQTILERLESFGFRNIYLCIRHLSESIVDFCGDGSRFGLKISYFKEREKLGTVGAVKHLESELKLPFLVINGDLLTILNYRNILNYHLDTGSDMTVGSTVYSSKIPFGVLDIDGIRIKQILEKPTYSYRVSGGIYVLNPSLLKYIPESMYYDITDLMATILSNNGSLSAFPIEEYWMDIGQLKDYKQANEDYTKIFNK